jgi:tight adherence protein B
MKSLKERYKTGQVLKMLFKKSIKFIIFIVFLIMAASLVFVLGLNNLSADESTPDSDIIIKKVYIDEFPEITFYMDFKEGSKIGSLELENQDLKILENDAEIKDFDIDKVDTIREPIGIVLAIDTSGSMKGNPILNAKGATIFFIDQMREIDNFAVVGFSDDVKVHSALTKDRSQLRNSIMQLEAEGETSLFDGIDISISQFKDFNIRYKYLIVLSDGLDTVSILKPEDNIRSAQNENITVYSIALISEDYSPSDIKRISESTGGELLVAANTEELKELYGSISEKIRNQYRVSYLSQWPNIETINTNIILAKSGISDTATISYGNPYFAPAPNQIIKEESLLYFKYLDFWWVRIILYFAIFASIILLIYAFVMVIFKPKPVLKSKTAIYGTKAKVVTETEDEVEGKKESTGFFRRLSSFTAKATSKRGFAEFFDIKLQRAGLKIRGSEFMTLHIISVAIIGILVQFFLKNIFITSAVILLLIFIPFLIINAMISQRIQKFDEQLPDALQLISGALKAGYSFNQALTMVVDELKPPISEELTKVLNEIRMGSSEREALESSADRVGSQHYAWMIMAINVQREVGGNMAEIMEIISNTIRERARVLNQIRALTAEGRLSAIILIALPICLGIVLFIINREYMSLLLDSRLGITMLIISGVLMIVGIIWILKIVRVKY